MKNKKIYKINRKYFSFEFRVIILLLLSLIIFFISINLLLISFNYYNKNKIKYNETSSSSYKVCLNNNNHYNEKCLKEGMSYVSSLTDYITVKFNYLRESNKKMSDSLRYYVYTKTSIYDDDTNKILYETEDKLTEEKDKVNKNSYILKIDEKCDVSYKKFNKMIDDYERKYGIKTNAKFEVGLYIIRDNNKKRVSYFTMPLNQTTYTIEKINKNNYNVIYENTKKKEENNFNIYLIIGIILLIISLLLLLVLANLVKASVISKSKYDKMLNKILREYDRIIVTVDDDLTGGKEILRINSFNELLDLKDSLNKPIIYTKINNIKSKFYIEDLDKVYTYVLKEADLDNDK